MTAVLKEHVTLPDPTESTQFDRMSSLTTKELGQVLMIVTAQARHILGRIWVFFRPVGLPGPTSLVILFNGPGLALYTIKSG